MKNSYLYLLFTVFFSSAAFGQSIEIHHDGVVVTSPNDVVDGDVGGTYFFQGYYIVNISESSLNLSWQRKAEFAENCLNDQVCTDESCYTPFDDGAIFNSPEPVTILPGDSTYFKVGASSIEFACCAIHKYYLTAGLGALQDSITVKFRIGETECFLGLEEDLTQDIKVYPNPASSELTILLNSYDSQSELKIYSILGEEVLSSKISSGKNEVNIENLANGIYFYTVTEQGHLIESKKLVIKH